MLKRASMLALAGIAALSMLAVAPTTADAFTMSMAVPHLPVHAGAFATGIERGGVSGPATAIEHGGAGGVATGIERGGASGPATAIERGGPGGAATGIERGGCNTCLRVYNLQHARALRLHRR